MSRTDPNTHLRFNYLPNDGRRYFVSDYGGMRLNSFFQCEIKVEISVQHPKPVDVFGNIRPEIISIWVPINEFRFFGEGNIFKSQRQYGRGKIGELRNFTELPNHSIADVSFKSGAAVHVHKVRDLIRSNRISHYTGAPYIVSSTNLGNPVFINPMEHLRFFFSSFGGITSYLYETAKTKEATQSLIDRNKTGYISDGVYRIVPNSAVSDISSAFQLALIETSPALQDIWSNFIVTLNSLAISNRPMCPEIQFPRDSINISALAFAANATIGTNPPDKCWVINQILSDRREIPFKTLIIEQPNVQYQTATEATAVGNGKSKSVSDINNIIIKKFAGTSNTRKYGFSGLSGLTEAFPNIGDVKIKVERPDKVELKTVVPTELKRKSLEEFSSSPSSSFMKTPGIIFRTPLQTREFFGGVSFEKGMPKRLLESPIQQYATYITNPGRLSERFSALVEASKILNRKVGNEMGHVYHKTINILELPRDWGTWAKGFVAGRSRYVAVIQYYNETRLNYAFEIENNENDKNKESYAIGIINKINNNHFDLHDLTCVMHHCSRRIYLRGKKRKPSQAYSGIWPSSIEYEDIIGTKLIHSAKREHPSFLAKDLLEYGIKKS